MYYVGIDFSINSPGICILHANTTKWLSYSSGPKTKAEGTFMESVAACQDVSFNLIHATVFTQVSIDNYSENEYQKINKYIQRASAIKSLILDELAKLGYTQGNEVHFGFEGFSYGSNTNNIIDIAIATGFLKKELIDTFENMTLSVLAPGTIKKSAGSGRYKKKEMYDVFVENRHSDSKLESSDFWNLCQSLRGAKKLFKPTDDLIDAYFIVNALRAIQLA
jgi:hypothetical protein